MILTYTDKAGCFYKHEFEEISIEDILSIEIERLPKTWKELCKNNPVKEEETKAYLALMQLHQLRDCYRGNTLSMYWYSIIRRGESDLIIVQDNTRFLSFPTKERASEFLNNFKDLIKQAGDLI